MQIDDKIKLAETYIMDFSLSHECHDCVELLKDYVEILKNKKEWKDRYIFDYNYDSQEHGRYNHIEFTISSQKDRYTIKEIKDLFKKSILELKDSILIYKFEQIFYFPTECALCYISLKDLFKKIDDGDIGYELIGENTIQHVISLDNLDTISDDDEDIQWGNQ